MQTLNNWTPTAVIVIGYLIGIFYQTHYVDKRFEDLYRYLDVLKQTMETHFKAIADRLDKIENRLDKLERPVIHQ